MARSLNKVMLIGNTGGDPELKYTQAGVAVVSFSMATSEQWKDKDGNPQEKTEWHSVTAWRKLAEIVGQYVKKGDRIFIEGKLQTRSWDDAATGAKRYKTEVVADQLIMLGNKASAADAPAAGDLEIPPEMMAGKKGGSDDPLPF